MTRWTFGRRDRWLPALAVPFAVILAAPMAAAQPRQDAGATANSPKNVIVMIADGMGYNHIDAASMYAFGKSRYQIEGSPGDVRRIPGPRNPNWVYERFPHQLAMSTHTAVGGYDSTAMWSDFDLRIGIEGDSTTVTGSAASGTALATGVKTIDPRVGLDVNGEPVKNLAERAKELGKATGVISNVAFNHATPAAFLAHNLDRNNRHAVAREMILDSGANVIMGAGHPYYNDDGQYGSPRYLWLPSDVWTAVQDGATPYTFVDERDDFVALAKGETPKHVLGIAKGFNATQFNRTPNPLDRSYRLGPPGLVDPNEKPFETPLNDNVPTLAEMTAAGLNVLSNASDEGFFVMIEGGALDWAGHWNLTGRNIEEMLFFNEAVKAAVDWIERESSWDETLLIVTGDHETGYLVGPKSGPDWKPLINNGPGEMPGHEWKHDYHTNSLVPLFAKGPAAERFRHAAQGRDAVWGPYVDNTDVANVVFDQWGR
ncbi:alkaline phosphatase [Micromonospora qiuiae]|uniref:Alkaline phosphatase n=1 Tax=Micromonospora qiuiae TaxID=502268 RepID=A0ABQ4JJK2_9ACTN|nr:alkaline phosphatase [Micromonospora qiuiae]